jgi:DNA-binding transcriptional ArsR family regulator
VKSFSHPNLDEVPLSTVMLALSDPSRMKIVHTLMATSDREFSCNEIDLGVAKSTVSHHLETLRNAGIIQTRSKGTKRLSSLRTRELNLRFPGLIDLLAAECE